MRRLLIAGNWKMNGGPARAAELVSGISDRLESRTGDAEVLVCPPHVSIPSALGAAGPGIRVGAQNVHYEEEGAYTGEISIAMLSELGCSHVITGHSERREYFGETNRDVNRKVRKVLAGGLTPIICVGESLSQRRDGSHRKVVGRQVEEALNEVDATGAKEVVIAYEPLWAIGTGETASPQQAQEMHGMIREELSGRYDSDLAGSVRILYGGSMKPHNAEELLSQPDVDGGLIGGASLKAESFAAIIEIADQISGN